jgi:GT2 family glycosyltransferase
MTTRPRVLLAVTVYNGRSFVPRCLRSALCIDQASADLDVLALDDASPEPGFSEELAQLCEEIGAGYYRTPRNLGIVRNVNLGLLSALQGGYDHVIISNSDVVYPANLLDGMLACLSSNDGVGSVTAWSNNVSIYSIPNADPDANLSDQGVVDWVSASLAGNYRGVAIDVPAGISFCILIPKEVVRTVGLMDTIYGRGYCEETDWTLRSLAAGYRIALAPGVFVYHAGRGSTLEAGMLAAGHTTVPANEAVIDFRYPLFRSSVDAFVSSGILQKAHADAAQRIISDAGRQFGYSIEVSWLPLVTHDDEIVRVLVKPAEVPGARARFRGFACEIPVDPADPGGSIRAWFGTEPKSIDLLGGSAEVRAVAASFPEGSPVHEVVSYPGRV